MIPEGWKNGSIKDLVKSLDAGVSVNSEDKLIQDGEIGVLKVSAVSYGFFLPNEHKVVLAAEELDRLTIYPKKDRILISRANTPPLVGASVYIDRDYPNLFLPDKLWQAEPRHNNFSVRWLSYLIASDEYKIKISSHATGTSKSMKNISKIDFLNIEIIIPPLPEQCKIAEILSSWDKAIALLEQLITAKRKLKQGIMQQLLTGKKRFNEFEGSEWAEHQLSEVATITMGTSTNSEAYNIRLWERSFGKPPSDWDYQLLNSFLSERTERQINDGTYPLFSLTIEEGITPKTDRYNREFLLNNAESNEYKVVYPGDIVYNPMNLRFGALAISNLKFAVIVSAYYNVLQIDKLKSNGNFLAYLLLSERLMSVYERVASGSLLEKKRVHFSEFRNIILPLPPLPEQQKIASILSTADTEISNLEKQLAAYKKQKRGLMQQLLTGKKRVKLNEPQMQKV